MYQEAVQQVNQPKSLKKVRPVAQTQTTKASVHYKLKKRVEKKNKKGSNQSKQTNSGWINILNCTLVSSTKAH